MAKILIVSPTPFLPSNAGNRARIANLIDLLENLDHEVHFLHVEREVGNKAAMQARLKQYFHSLEYPSNQEKQGSWIKRKYTKLLRKLDIDAGYQLDVDAWYIEDIGIKVIELEDANQFDVVIVEYAYLSKLLERLPRHVVKVIDTHDVFANRHRKYLDKGMPPTWFSCSTEDENRALNRADIVCAIQDNEANDFANRVDSTVVTLGYLPVAQPLPFPKTETIPLLYIGSANPINKMSILWFLDSVWPLLNKQHPFELIVAGTVSNELQPMAHVTLIGAVDELIEVYAKAKLVINPAQFGTGLKIKTIESLAFGRPLISTSVGLEGLTAPAPSPWIEANTAESFAAAITKFAYNPSDFRKMSVAATHFVEQYTLENTEVFKASLQAALDEKREEKSAS